MKLLVVGSRGINGFDLSGYIPDNTELIISGGADGVDTTAEKYADVHRISKLVLRPSYRIYGKAAPLKRNEIMVDIADSVLVIWDGNSKGTKYTIDYAKKRNKPINIVIV